MKKALLLSMLALGLATSSYAQKYFTREGHISFLSDTPMERIEGHNRTVTSVLDAATGRLEFAALIKAFQFEKALMQEHFNENYMESSTYPKATFKGQIANASSVNYTRDGQYPVEITGQLTMHGVTKTITVPAIIKVQAGKVSATSNFQVAVADYGIVIPAVVRENIAKMVRIQVDVAYQPYTN